jgi:hypothetical protein
VHNLLLTVSAVLFDHWDPLGVRAEDERWPRDEYEGYAAGVLGLLERRASDDVVAEHLARLESAWMGLAPTPLTHRLGVVARLRAAIRAVGRPDTVG